MNPATFRRSALVGIAVLILLGSNVAFADPKGTATTQPINFTVGTQAAPAGTVVNLGDQKYAVSGGQVALAMIGGQQVDPGATLKFSLNAQVKGLSATGNVHFELKGTIAGVPISVKGDFPVNRTMTQALSMVVPGPSGSCLGKAAKSCSELPTFFAGTGNVNVKVGDPSKPMKMTMMLENPYFNPFGAPILLASADGSISIVTTYDVGKITWAGSEVTGPINGTLGSSTPISGTLSLNTTETENLVTGTAVDRGTIALDGMTPAWLDTIGRPGTYTGTSCIPGPDPACTPVPPGSGADCTPMFNIPGVTSGLCTATGFDSMGHFTVNADPPHEQRVTINGTYATTWTAPALAFSSVVSGTVTTQSK